MMVSVLVIADEVAANLQEHTLRGLSPDLVLSAGDLPWDYLEWIVSTLDAPAVFVPGNHDPEIPAARLGRNGAYTRDGMPCDSPRPHGWLNADQRVLSAAGLWIAGLGGCVQYRPGPHQFTQREYHRRGRRLLRRARRSAVDVLLTHTPPLGLGDEEDRPHVGVAALHEVLERLQPTWHLHGHIHPYGQPRPDRRVGPTTIRNVIPWTVLDIAPRNARGSVRSVAGAGG